jgi:hypothetical protein
LYINIQNIYNKYTGKGKKNKMKTTIKAPVIHMPIELHYCDFYTFKDYFEKQTGNPFDMAQCDGAVSTFIKGRNVKIVVWIEDDGDHDWVPIMLIAHESFHIVCKLRREMYALDEDDDLIIGAQSEEDWAYIYGEIVGKISTTIDKWMRHAKKEINATTED